MQNKITSLTNQKIKDVVKLRDRKHRDKTKLTIVEGHREVLRAIDAAVEFVELYIDPSLISKYDNKQIIYKVEALNKPVVYTSKDVFNKIAYGDRNEGIIGICKHWDTSIKEPVHKPDALYVIAEGVEKPGNFGAMLRTCDGAGVDGIIVSDGKIDIFNPNVIRASLGAIFFVKVFVCSNEETLEFASKSDIKVCSTSPTADKNYTEVDMTGPTAIVVGCEHTGLSDFWQDNADILVSIPMKGIVDSLNVSSSAAIVLYEAIRQRTRK